MSGNLIHLLTDSTSNAIDSLKIFNNAIVAKQDSLNPKRLLNLRMGLRKLFRKGVRENPHVYKKNEE